MKLPRFKLEEYLCQWEFRAQRLLCVSDLETLSLKKLLSLADPESLRLWENLTLGYTEAQGLPILREAIAELYSNINSEQTLCFAGAEEAIYLSMATLIAPGDHVVVVTPCYQSLITLPESFGAEVTAIPLDSSNGWKLDLDRLHQSLRANTRLIVINYPHNPTGALLTQAEMQRIIVMAREVGAYVFSDEVYRLLEYDEADRLPAIADSYERGISLSVTSKAFGLAGLRIGWLACRDKELLRAIADQKHYTTICNSAPSEILALMAIRARDPILERNRQIVRKNLAILREFFDRHKDLFAWHEPRAGCIAFPKLLSSEPIEVFAQELLEQESVLLLPGSAYDDVENHFRIGFGRSNMFASLEYFETFIKNRKAKVV